MAKNAPGKHYRDGITLAELFQCFPDDGQDYLVFGSDLGFSSHMLRFSRNIASTARFYSGKTFTHIK